MMSNKIIHIQKTVTHINLVKAACIELNTIYDNIISDEEIKNHDASKFSELELDGYVKQFYTNDKNSKEWQYALMHHYKNNPHHWQYWLDGFEFLDTELECKPTDMPEEQILIMVSDWLSVGYQYTKTKNISVWLNNNLDNIVVTKNTLKFIIDVLHDIGYIRMVDAVCGNFWTLRKNSFIENLTTEFDTIKKYGVL